MVVRTIDANGASTGIGSGVVLSPDGLVATNEHVIRGADGIVLELASGRHMIAVQLVADERRDLAILWTPKRNLSPARLGDSDRVQIGESVVAIGSPRGLSHTLSTGIVSGIRYAKGYRYIQTTVSISAGSSGGPILNMNGEVLGLAVGFLRDAQNLNFALPSNDIRAALGQARIALRELQTELAQQRALEEAVKRRAEEDERQRRAAVEAEKRAAKEAARRAAEEEAARQRAEAEAARKAAEAEHREHQARRAAEQEERRQAAARRYAGLQAEQAEKRRAAEASAAVAARTAEQRRIADDAVRRGTERTGVAITAPRPVEFPPPTISIMVSPVPIGVERPRPNPPPAAPLPAPARDPIQDHVRYRLGEALEQEGRLLEAKNHYRELRDKGRDEAIAQRATYRLGLVGLRENDTAAARRECETLLRAGILPELREGVLLLVAESAVRRNDPNRAVAVLRTALRDYPDSSRSAQTRLALGWALLQDGDAETALREWSEVATAADPEIRAHALIAMADVALRQGREGEALSALRGVTTPPPGLRNADAVTLNRGILALRTGAYAEAVQSLEPLAPRIADLPMQGLARRALGVVQFKLGRHDQAERQFRLAANATPQEPSSWLGAGLAALAQGRHTQAEDALQRARFAAVDVATSAWYGLVLVSVQRGDRETFRERGTNFVDRFPKHPAVPAVLYGLAAAALDRKDLGEGQVWTQRLLREHAASDYGTDALIRLAEAAGTRPEHRPPGVPRPPDPLRAGGRAGVRLARTRRVGARGR